MWIGPTGGSGRSYSVKSSSSVRRVEILSLSGPVESVLSLHFDDWSFFFVFLLDRFAKQSLSEIAAWSKGRRLILGFTIGGDTRAFCVL